MTQHEKLPYDPSDERSILEYALVLLDSTLRENTDAEEIQSAKRNKGAFGNAIEYYYFRIRQNSDREPDFKEVGMELKSTPLKKLKSGKLVAKERLVITDINYNEEATKTFETSHLVRKAKKILLISYLWEKGKDPLDYIIKVVSKWGLPEEDMPIFKQDWETVVAKIRDGHAEQISGSDTLYLEACTKSSDSTKRTSQPYSDTPAKPRAWALKGSYMTAVQQGLLADMEPLKRGADEREIPLLELVRMRFDPYFGMTKEELAERFGLIKPGGKEPKSIYALITRNILGVEDEQKIAEFVKAGVKPKTIRLKRSGRPKEAMSFPFFDYFKLAETDFEDSDFKSYMEQKYLFVIYREDASKNDVYHLAGVAFWQMPDDDLLEARRCYDEMRKRVIEGRAEDSVKSTENRCCHVRPHDTKTSKPIQTPQGVPMKRKCFWLNQNYLKDQIATIMQR